MNIDITPDLLERLGASPAVVEWYYYFAPDEHLTVSLVWIPTDTDDMSMNSTCL